MPQGPTLRVRITGQPRLRKAPSTDAEIVLETIPDGTEARASSHGGGWYGLTLVAPGQAFDGATGFVVEGFVEVVGQEPQPGTLVFKEEAPPQQRPMTGLIQALLKITADGKFGPSTTEAVRRFQAQEGLSPVNGEIDQRTGEALGLTNWMDSKNRTLAFPFTETTQTQWSFRSFVPGGFFSHWVDESFQEGNPLTLRAIRSNNPGAINIASWRFSFPGYVGKTRPDNSPNHNETMIFSAPEYGVAAWRFWMHKKVAATTRLSVIIDLYRGGIPFDDYLRGYIKFSNGLFDRDTLINQSDDAQMAILARAVFSHEAGLWFPLTDEQFRKGVEIGRAHIEAQKSDPMPKRIGRAIYEFGIVVQDMVKRALGPLSPSVRDARRAPLRH